MAQVLSYDALTWAWTTSGVGNDRLPAYFATTSDPPQPIPDSTPEPIPSSLAGFIRNSKTIFLRQPGDSWTGIRLFDGPGSAASNGTELVGMSYLSGDTLQWVSLGTFDGGSYDEWRTLVSGVNIAAFRYDTPGLKGTYPKALQFIGTPGYVPKTPAIRPGRLDDKNAVNSYWFNIFDPSNVHGPPPEADLDQLRKYSGWRFYLPQQDITDDDRSLRLYSARSGGAHYVELAQLIVQEGKFGVYSFMGNSRANIATWTYTETNPDGSTTVKVDGDMGSNAAWAKGADLYNPESYRHWGENGWDVGAMFGSVVYPTDQLRQATTPLSTYDPQPVLYTGLNVFGPDKITPQFLNEAAKTWKNKTYPDGQQLNAYLPPDAAAIAYAVWRDGYNGTMGPRVGICAADPAIQPTMGLLFGADAGYIHAFAEKLREIYGSNPDGSVKNMPLQVDVHEYARATDGSGVPFSQTTLPTRFAALNRVLDVVSPSSSLVLSEYGYTRISGTAGYDDNSNYRATGYSYLQPTSELPDPRIRRAAVTCDMAVELAVLRVGQSYGYDDDHGFRTETKDLYWDLGCDMDGEPVQDWMQRLDQVSTGYGLTSFTRQNGGLVARFAKSGASELVIMTAGATSLPFASAATVTPYSLATGTQGAPQFMGPGGTYARTASEVPTVLLLSTSSTTTPGTGTGNGGTGSGGTGSGGTGTPPPSNSKVILQRRPTRGGSGSTTDVNALSRVATTDQGVASAVNFAQAPSVPDLLVTSAPAGLQQYSQLAAAFAALVNGAPGALDTLKEIADQLALDEQGAAAMLATIQQHTQQLNGIPVDWATAAGWQANGTVPRAGLYAVNFYGSRTIMVHAAGGYFNILGLRLEGSPGNYYAAYGCLIDWEKSSQFAFATGGNGSTVLSDQGTYIVPPGAALGSPAMVLANGGWAGYATLDLALNAASLSTLSINRTQLQLGATNTRQPSLEAV